MTCFYLYSGLNEKVPQRLTCLNTWFLIGGATWGGCVNLGGDVLLEELYYCDSLWACMISHPVFASSLF